MIRRIVFSAFGGAALIAGTSACDKEAERKSSVASAKPSASAHAAAPGLEKLEAMVDGQPLVFRSAIASSRTSSLLALDLSTEALTCASLQTGELEQGRHLRLEVTPELRRDGTRKQTLRARTFEGAAESSFTSFELVDGDVASKVRLKLEGVVTSEAGRKLTLGGEVTLEGCGQLPPAAGAKDNPQPELNLEVAGQRFGITGAILRARPERRFALELSSAPNSCAGDAPVGDVELRLVGTLDPPSVEATYLYGDVLEKHESRREGEGLDVKLEFGSEEDGRVPVQLKGTYDHDGYRVSFSGKVRADVCIE